MVPLHLQRKHALVSSRRKSSCLLIEKTSSCCSWDTDLLKEIWLEKDFERAKRYKSSVAGIPMIHRSQNPKASIRIGNLICQSVLRKDAQHCSIRSLTRHLAIQFRIK